MKAPGGGFVPSPLRGTNRDARPSRACAPAWRIACGLSARDLLDVRARGARSFPARGEGRPPPGAEPMRGSPVSSLATSRSARSECRLPLRREQAAPSARANLAGGARCGARHLAMRSAPRCRDARHAAAAGSRCDACTRSRAAQVDARSQPSRPWSSPSPRRPPRQNRAARTWRANGRRPTGRSARHGSVALGRLGDERRTNHVLRCL